MVYDIHMKELSNREQTLEICKVVMDAGFSLEPGFEDEDGDSVEFDLLHYFEEIGMEGYDVFLYFTDEVQNSYFNPDKKPISYAAFMKKLKESLKAYKEKRQEE